MIAKKIAEECVSIYEKKGFKKGSIPNFTFTDVESAVQKILKELLERFPKKNYPESGSYECLTKMKEPYLLGCYEMYDELKAWLEKEIVGEEEISWKHLEDKPPYPDYKVPEPPEEEPEGESKEWCSHISWKENFCFSPSSKRYPPNQMLRNEQSQSN